MSASIRGVLVTIKMVEDKLRLGLDDVVQQGPRQWEQDVLVTFKDYDPESFKKLERNYQELAALGHYIWARR